MSVKKFFWFLAVAVWQLIPQQAKAGIYPWGNRLQGSISTSGKDTVWVDVSPRTGSFKDVKVLDFINVAVDHTYPVYVKDSAVYRIFTSIKKYDVANNLIGTVTHTFTVVFDPFGKTAMRDQDMFMFQGAYKYKVTFTGGTKNGTSITSLPDYLYIDANVSIERYYDMLTYAGSSPSSIGSDTLDTDCDVNLIQDELRVYWSMTLGGGTVYPESFDLEWTFINDYDSVSTHFLNPSNLNYDFVNNSTRVSLSDNSYHISLVFEHGYVIYRVRAIGRDTAHPDHIIVGAWSLPDVGTVSSASGNYYWVTKPHEKGKNWQYNASFAEEGKKKEVVSYFDGSLRNRQSVTKMNSNRNTLVGETIYDYQGRPAINVLPVPVDYPACGNDSSVAAFKFFPNFNRNESSVAYSRSDFDVDSSGNPCSSTIAPMDTAYGASHYYSPDNPNKADQQAYVPDAKKYPFTQVEYTPDNTGRIRRQGGVGPKHQLGSGHETKYFYGQPTQIELDRMFGSEVGDAAHYKKNIAEDANGQASITYLDQEGRTIATSLAGDTTIGLNKLSSNKPPVNLKADLFNKDANGNSQLNTISISGNSIEFNTQLLVNSRSTNYFSYSMAVDTMADSCLRANVCFNCVYDLEMHVYDACGIDILAEHKGDTLKKHVGHFSIVADTLVFTTACTGGVTEQDTFPLLLETGNYTVTKVLTVNKQAVDYYVQQYLDTTNNSCYKDLSSFIQDALSNVDTSSCHVTCASCLAKLGDRDAFVANGKGSYEDYDVLADACMEPCKAKSDCYIRYVQMVSDMTLGGQYGDYVDNSGNYNPSPFPLSVYDTTNVLPDNVSGTGNWHYPSVTLNNHTYHQYLDVTGHPYKVYLRDSSTFYLPRVRSNSAVFYDSANASYYTDPSNLYYFSDFVANWQSSFAKSLVLYHPEYCYYENCAGFGQQASGDYTTSDAFDALLQNTNKMSDAIAAGLVTYDGTKHEYVAGTYSVVSSTYPYDPFLVHSGTYGSSSLITLLNNYSTQPVPGYTMSMTEFAAFTTRCGMLYGNTDTTGCIRFGSTAPDSIKDQEWNLFKGFYLSAKQNLQQKYLDNIAKTTCPSYNGCIGDSNNTYNPFTALGGQYNNPAQPCALSTYHLYANKIRRFGSAAAYVSFTQNNANYQSYLATGQCPIATEVQHLLSQIASQDTLTDGTHVALQGYTMFSPDIYKILGGDPTSTYTPFYWNSSTSGTAITAEFKDASGDTVCSLHMDLSVSGLSSFTGYKILGLTGLADTSYTGSQPNSFRVYFILRDISSGNTVLKMALGYSSCFNLTGCQFTDVCTPNDFANDLQNLMTVLAKNHKLGWTYVHLDVSPFSTYITNHIKNELGTTTSNQLSWTYNNSGKYFALYDRADSLHALIMGFGGDTSHLMVTPFSHISGFNSINSNYYNNFVITALDSIDGTSKALNGVIKKYSIVGSDTIIEGISMGSCGYPASFNCQGTPYQLQNDLQLLIHDALTTMTSYDIDLTKLPSYSDVISNAFPAGLDSTSSQLVLHTTGWGNYKTQLLFTIKSDVDSCYFSLNADTISNHGFQHISDFTDFHVYGPVDGNGNYHQFYGIAHYTGVLSAPSQDTIFGQSCLPILNCCACGTNDTVSVTTPADTCSSAYTAFVNGVAAFNASAFAIANSYTIQSTSILTYYDMTHFDFCGCVSKYLDYLNTYTDTTFRPAYITQYTPCTNNQYETDVDHNCEKIGWREWLDAANNFNTVHTSLSLPAVNTSNYDQFTFNTSGFCYCYPAYIAFLKAIENHSIPVASVDTNMLDISKFCASNFTPPCKAYVAPDTTTTYPPGSGVPPTKDTSCAQYAINVAIQNATNQYNQYRDSLTTLITNKYITHCLGATELFTDSSKDQQYHYTLYYYDQAGNLVRTIPPEGVNLVNVTGPPNVPFTTPLTAADSICYDRTNNKHIFMTDHTLPTTYLYNSLNQLVKQSMPDHDPVDIWEYTLPNGLNSRLKITGVQFVNENQGYLTGYITLADTIVPKIIRRGYIYTTANGGKSWQPMNDVVSGSFNKVQMVTSHTGYAIGKNGMLLKTVDGGSNWDIIPTFNEYTSTWGFAPEWKDLYFNDSIRGIVVGTNGKSLMVDFSQASPANYIKTISLSGANASDTLTGVTFDGSNAYACSKSVGGFGYIFESNVNPFTLDSLKWVLVTGITANDLYGLQFLSAKPDTGFICGINGTLLKTKDAGVHWESVNTGLTSSVRRIFFRNDSVGIALVDSASGYSKLYRTHSGGTSWTVMSSPGQYISAVSPYKSSNATTADKLYAAGNSGFVGRIIATTNTVTPYFGTSPYFGLGTVNSPNLNINFSCVSVATYTPSSVIRPKVILGADNGKVYYSQIADSSVVAWDSLVVCSTPLKKIALRLRATTNKMQAVAIDTSGIIYGIDINTGDTSMTNTSLKFTDVTYHLADSAFYAYEKTGKKVYKFTFTTGATPKISPTVKSANSSLSVVNAIAFSWNDLIVVGGNGDIYKDSLVTSTSGTWVNESGSLKLLPLNDIQTDYYSTPALYAVGNNGTVLQKKPSGSWTKLSAPSGKNFNAIKFNDRSKGVIVGDNAKMYVATVNTTSYTVTFSAPTYTGSTASNLNDLMINTTNHTMYAVGNNGLVVNIPNMTVSSPTATAVNLGTNNIHNYQGAGLWPNGTLLAVGDGNTIINYNGTAVNRISSIFSQEFYKAHFADIANGYLVGENGFMRHTSDGVSWQAVLPDLTPSVIDSVTNVLTYQDDKAAVIGKNGYMAKISGTGTPVQVSLTGTVTGTPDLNDIAMGGNTTSFGYVVGDSKTVFKFTVPSFSITSINPGSLPLPSSYDLHALYVFLDNSIMAVGSKGSALFYRAQGGTWYRHGVPNPPSSTDSTKYNFNDVYFHDDRNGYVVGDKGVVLRWSSTNNIQNITNNTFSTNTYFAPKPTADDWESDSTKFNITCTGWPGRYDGFLGGMYPDSITGAKYARLVHDESQLFSTFFWYDALGRMVLSQNSKQFAKSPKAYSYTRYDALGRIAEVGEKAENTTGTLRFSRIFGQVINNVAYNIINNDSMNTWLDVGGRTEVTHTYYDSVGIAGIPLTQDNLRKRVSAVTYEDTDDGDSSTYNHGTFYSYDIHGNVSTLLQDNPSLASIKQRFKRIDYDYDLISGKVNDVFYEQDSLDAFTHHYEYDADNRITAVYTSRYPSVQWRNVQHDPFWDNDAKYFYYDHGPLARVEFGQHHVQGMDYAYTLQGWIKAVNSEALQPGYDMGKDGLHDTANCHRHFAKDAFGYSLTYFKDDYTAIGWTNDSSKRFLSSQYFAPGTASDLIAFRNDLYNGNITAMATSLTNPATGLAMPQGNTYQYDQLNRLVKAKSFQELLAWGNVWNNENYYYSWESFAYPNQFVYDANGNITSQIRKNEMGQTFDSLTYRYKFDSQGRKTQNRLYHVNDTITASMLNDDIDNQGTFNSTINTINQVNNYSYDKIGNLVKDSAEGIATIDWTVYGKIKSVTHRTGYYKLSGTDTVRPPDLVFNYDAAGNRISKVVKPRTATGLKSNSYWKTQYYVRDAQGNILSTYNQRDSVAISTAYFTQAERHVYGSSRLGIDNTQTELLGASFSTDTSSHYVGNKSYEMSNHLGNVLTTVSDKRKAIDPKVIPYLYSNPDVMRASIDTAGGMKIQPLTAGAGMNIIYESDSGQSYRLDFYVKTGNMTAGDNLSANAYDITGGSHFTTIGIPTTGHYTINYTAISGVSALKVLNFDSTGTGNAPNDYFYLDSVKITITGSTADTILVYEPDIKSVSDYYPFGSVMTARTWNSYEYGFAGRMKTDEFYGSGNSYDFGERMQDPRLGRWMSIDKLTSKFPYASPYSYTLNNPIYYYDPDGNTVAPVDQKTREQFDAQVKSIFSGELAEIAQKITYTTIGTVRVGENDVAIKGYVFMDPNGGGIDKAVSTIQKSSLKPEQKLKALAYLATVATPDVVYIQSGQSKDNPTEQTPVMESGKLRRDVQLYTEGDRKNTDLVTNEDAPYYPNENPKINVKNGTSTGTGVSGIYNLNSPSAENIDKAVIDYSQKTSPMDSKVSVKTKDASGATYKYGTNGAVEKKEPKK